MEYQSTPLHNFQEGYGINIKGWKMLISDLCENANANDSVKVFDFGTKNDLLVEILKNQDGEYKVLVSDKDGEDRGTWEDWGNLDEVKDCLNDLYPDIGRFDVVAGPNTNQLWIYDNDKDAYIDPPLAVLEEADQQEDAEKYLQDVVDENPDWLYDTDCTYDDPEMEI